MTIKNSEYLQADTHIEGIPDLIYERKEAEELKNRIIGYFNGVGQSFTRLLSGPSGSGKTISILFIIYNFIQQNPQFSKDIIYINGDKVTTVIENAKPGTSEANLEIYQPDSESNKVLEINGGLAKKYNIKKGTIIKTGSL